MKMNILKQELKMSFRSWFWFTSSMLALLIMFGSFFNVFKDQAIEVDKLLQNFPAEFRAAFGFADVNLSEIEGFFSFIMSYMVLIGAVFGMKLGISLLSEESRRKTADFLLTKPIRRHEVVTGKLLAILLQLVIQNMLIFGIGIVFLQIITSESFDLVVYFLLTLSILLVQLFFVGVGLAIAAILNRIKSVMPITLGVVFFFFIIELVNESIREKALSYITPFAYFQGSSILRTRNYDTAFLVIDLSVFILLTILAYWIYCKKDIHAV